MLSHIWVKPESDLDQISTKSWLVLINSDEFVTLFTHDWCCYLCQLHITYNVIYTHYNQRWIIIQLKVSLFLIFSWRFEDFYRELLKWNHNYASSFIKINQDINYWDQEWTHLKKKTIVMMNWHIKIKSETKVKDWIKDQIWINFETLWLCQDII